MKTVKVVILYLAVLFATVVAIFIIAAIYLTIVATPL